MASESRVAAIESWISVYLTVHRPLDADAIGHSEFARVIEFRDLDFFSLIQSENARGSFILSTILNLSP